MNIGRDRLRNLSLFLRKNKLSVSHCLNNLIENWQNIPYQKNPEAFKLREFKFGDGDSPRSRIEDIESDCRFQKNPPGRTVRAQSEGNLKAIIALG